MICCEALREEKKTESRRKKKQKNQPSTQGGEWGALIYLKNLVVVRAVDGGSKEGGEEGGERVKTQRQTDRWT